MKILSIETSCDETAIAVIDAEGKLPNAQFEVFSNIVLSQAKLHAKYGGVFPSLAKREHAKNLIPVFEKSLGEAGFLQQKSLTHNHKSNYSLIRANKRIVAVLERESELCDQFLKFIPNIKKPPIDAIAVTYGPGLEPALWVGINFAKALSFVWDMPIIPVNHMEGHLFSALLKKDNEPQTTSYKLQKIAFPAITLLISGGHTELVLMKDWGDYKIVGETRDDAVGEAFDKVARMLGLPYPGGPAISTEAKKWDDTHSSLTLPRPMIDSGDFDFSFSGLKTAVLYKLKEFQKSTMSGYEQPEELPREVVQEFAYEFQKAVTDVLVSKTIASVEHLGAKSILLGGGVSANDHIREILDKETREKLPGVKLFISPKELTGDNALMIAIAGYANRSTQLTTQEIEHLCAEGTLRFGT